MFKVSFIEHPPVPSKAKRPTFLYCAYHNYSPTDTPALRGVKNCLMPAEKLLMYNLLVYGLGGMMASLEESYTEFLSPFGSMRTSAERSHKPRTMYEACIYRFHYYLLLYSYVLCAEI